MSEFDVGEHRKTGQLGLGGHDLGQQLSGHTRGLLKAANDQGLGTGKARLLDERDQVPVEIPNRLEPIAVSHSEVSAVVASSPTELDPWALHDEFVVRARHRWDRSATGPAPASGRLPTPWFWPPGIRTGDRVLRRGAGATAKPPGPERSRQTHRARAVGERWTRRFHVGRGGVSMRRPPMPEG